MDESGQDVHSHTPHSRSEYTGIGQNHLKPLLKRTRIDEISHLTIEIASARMGQHVIHELEYPAKGLLVMERNPIVGELSLVLIGYPFTFCSQLL